MRKLNPCKTAIVMFLLCAAAVAQAQTFTTLVNFNGANGANPLYAALVQGFDGNLYGTTIGGGNDGQNPDCGGGYVGCGTAFKMTRRGELVTLYSFCPQLDCTNGAAPAAGLVAGSDGSFYGTTTSGGAGHNSGTVYRMTPTGTTTTLYTFCQEQNCTDGFYPVAGLIQADGGSFYGTTEGGGNGGTIFSITPQGTAMTLHDFNWADGADPTAALVQATDGNFYGTAYLGGAYFGGTVFRITREGKLTTLYNFCATNNCPDGKDPFGSLTQGNDRNFYGTTESGGAFGQGTAFKITPAGTFTTLHSFNGADGSGPLSGLVQATDGNFYGTVSDGGDYGCGTIFRITPGGDLTTLHSFNMSDGCEPASALFQSTNGILYGTTSEGANQESGTVFSLDVGLGPFLILEGYSGKVGRTGFILGQGFTGTTSVSLNGTPAIFTVESDALIQATVPVGGTTGFVTVTTPTGPLTSNLPFRVTPQLLSFSPPSGPVGTTVTITGVSLTQTTGVGFGDQVPASFTVNSDTQVMATVPSGAKTGSVAIQTLGGIAISSALFTVTQ